MTADLTISFMIRAWHSTAWLVCSKGSAAGSGLVPVARGLDGFPGDGENKTVLLIGGVEHDKGGCNGGGHFMPGKGERSRLVGLKTVGSLRRECPLWWVSR